LTIPSRLGAKRNPILATNNARIRIVLDSRNGHSRLLDFPATIPTTTGCGPTESAILGVLGATGFQVRGLCFLGSARGTDQGVEMYGVSFAKAPPASCEAAGLAPDG
jgi:hypothetical protein